MSILVLIGTTGVPSFYLVLKVYDRGVCDVEKAIQFLFACPTLSHTIPFITVQRQRSQRIFRAWKSHTYAHGENKHSIAFSPSQTLLSYIFKYTPFKANFTLKLLHTLFVIKVEYFILLQQHHFALAFISSMRLSQFSHHGVLTISDFSSDPSRGQIKKKKFDHPSIPIFCPFPPFLGLHFVDPGAKAPSVLPPGNESEV